MGKNGDTMKKFELTFLGTGTSTGVPEIGCHCEICRSKNPKDQRLRSSIWIRYGELSILVDATPDLRQQCLRENIPDVNAVFFTHLHADHFLGLDDLRRYNMIYKRAIPIYLPFHMEDYFKAVFGYTLRPAPKGVTVPNFELNLIDNKTIKLGDLKVTPLPILHGQDEIRGYLFEFQTFKLAYLTDCKEIPAETAVLIKDVDVMILGAIWKNRHKNVKHFDLEEAINAAESLSPKRLYLTHFSHHMGHHTELVDELAVDYPNYVHPAYDGLTITLSED